MHHDPKSLLARRFEIALSVILFCTAFAIQIHIDNHTLSATPEAAKETFARAVEWQVAHTLAHVTIGDGVRSYSIADFASAITLLDIANAVVAMSDRTPKVLEQ